MEGLPTEGGGGFACPMALWECRPPVGTEWWTGVKTLPSLLLEYSTLGLILNFVCEHIASKYIFLTAMNYLNVKRKTKIAQCLSSSRLLRTTFDQESSVTIQEEHPLLTGP